MEPNTDLIADAKGLGKTKKIIFFLLTFAFSILLTGLSYLKSESLKEIAMGFYNFPNPVYLLAQNDSVKLAKQLAATRKKVAELERRIENMSPYDPYMIVNTTSNTFVLRTRNKIIREGLCSTGSYTLLDAGVDSQWIFKTPKGMFRIQGKITDPLWIKPDWAFIEEGLPIPAKNHPDRYQYGTLGDYALSLGKGYLIHGTLYQRYLGLAVTHGCIRMGDKDLEIVYKTLEVGSRVYIY